MTASQWAYPGLSRTLVAKEQHPRLLHQISAESFHYVINLLGGSHVEEYDSPECTAQVGVLYFGPYQYTPGGRSGGGGLVPTTSSTAAM